MQLMHEWMDVMRQIASESKYQTQVSGDKKVSFFHEKITYFYLAGNLQDVFFLEAIIIKI